MKEKNYQFLKQYFQITECQAIVGELIIEGKSNQQISVILNKSYHTIVTHRKNLFRKIEVKNTRQFMAKFLDKKNEIETNIIEEMILKKAQELFEAKMKETK
ncbi:MAG: LuxR family transcriptional regulator [Bacteroidetes bacterium]|nr:MAG: LuxR family transcriptional regulator [Bacteroidota bacterium]